MNSLEFEVVGVFQTFSKEFDARAVRIPLAAAQELLNTQGINRIVLSLKKTEDTERVTRSLAAQLDGTLYELKTWRQLNDFYQKTVDLYARQFGVLRLIVLIMVFLGVANTINMSVFERTGEFGTMMALGNTRMTIFQLVLLENVLLGVIGASMGALLGVALAVLISTVGIVMPPPPNANIGYTALIRIVPSVVVMAFLVGLIATILAAIFPASRVARTPIDEALRQNV